MAAWYGTHGTPSGARSCPEETYHEALKPPEQTLGYKYEDTRLTNEEYAQFPEWKYRNLKAARI